MDIAKRSIVSQSTILALVAVLGLAGACAKKKPKVVPVTKAKAVPRPIGWHETGIASWYGEPYHGKPAANGEIFDMEKLTAAHRTLPLETWVRVQNLSNRREVEVRITDRGPFIEGRIIDLSKAAAREIDMLRDGVTKVRLTVIAPPRQSAGKKPKVEAAADPVPPPSTKSGDGDAPGWSVQAGAFSERANADRLRDALAPRYGLVRIVEKRNATARWRVLVGELNSEAEAENLRARLKAQEKIDGFVIRLPWVPES